MAKIFWSRWSNHHHHATEFKSVKEALRAAVDFERVGLCFESRIVVGISREDLGSPIFTADEVREATRAFEGTHPNLTFRDRDPECARKWQQFCERARAAQGAV